jgi:hypothetical protein
MSILAFPTNRKGETMKIRTAHYRLVPSVYCQSGRKNEPLALVRTHEVTRIDELSCKGGVTHVQVLDDNGELLREAIAVCSIKDNFCRKLGRKIALGRVNSVVMPSNFRLPRGYEAVDIPVELKKFI